MTFQGTKLIKSRLIFALLSVVVLSSFLLPAAGCSAPERDFDACLHEITEPYHFNLAGWELQAISSEIGRLFVPREEIADNVTSVFFSNVERIRRLESEIAAVKAGRRQGDLAALEDELGKLQSQNAALLEPLERLLETQVREAYSGQGIYNPLDRYASFKIGFPPLNIHLGTPPHLLVISPRDRIESMREIILLPDMSVEDMEKIEAEIDSFGVSSLVVNLGGMATYPSYVTDKADVRFMLNTAAEEWLHQYLAFTPLGFRYVLDLAGIRRDYDIATMNEAVAGIVSKEIGALVYEQYCATGEYDDANRTVESGFDFNKEMREIRKVVDEYLAKGEIEQAEEFMEEKRLYLAENGYYIRKLNQAYFAFHGAYADSPTSVSPIGVDLRELRKRSTSLREFLDTVAGMTCLEELAESLQE
ncbi:MAG: hypothetical protein JXA51_07065 [Dehalococcoidales bacterium]|nr:hypothetical protein [Dehalococcoidales bacterium]